MPARNHLQTAISIPIIRGSSALPGLLTSLIVLLTGACADAGEDAEGHGLPSDDQVIADVTPGDRQNVVDVQVVAGRTGESYLHPDSFTWVFDRGVVIRRNANVPGAPDAVVVVGGLARYERVGSDYVYSRFLTTYNEYEGISSPSSAELLQFVEQNLDKVFMGRAHNVLAVESVEMPADGRWTWHTPNSFTVPFEFHYRQRASYTTVEERADTLDVRFYRDALDAPLTNLLATESSRSVLRSYERTAAELDRMPSLQAGFQ